MKPEVSRVIAAGGVGTWFTFDYLIYILVGVIGVAVSALFYHLIGYRETRLTNIFSWIHLVLMNVGATVSAGRMMHAGYIGGAAALAPAAGGQGLGQGEVHTLIAQYVEPIELRYWCCARG